MLCRRESTPAQESSPPSRVPLLLGVLAAVVVGGIALVRWEPHRAAADLPAGVADAEAMTREGMETPPQRGPARGADLPAPARMGVTGTLATRNSAGRSGAYYLPSGHDGEPRPLLVAIHGTGGDGRGMVGLFRQAAEREAFFIVAPDSRRSPGGQFTWQVGDHPGEVTEDLEHVGHCVDELRAMAGVQIDPARILIAGHSGGGSEAPYIATNQEPFTAFAVLARWSVRDRARPETCAGMVLDGRRRSSATARQSAARRRISGRTTT